MHRLWIAFVLVLMVSFTILGWIGTRINAEKPPIPERVMTTNGTVLIDNGQIESGQSLDQHLDIGRFVIDEQDALRHWIG